MAKIVPKTPEKSIIQTSLEEVLARSMMPYAEHVILERALPRVEDGLKPVQRRILYTMMELGLSPDKPHRKSARIVGDCLGKYHPHGDSSVYEALVRMAQPFSLRSTMVDGHGNFGSIDGDSAAAMRYTEVRMTPMALEMLRDIQKDTVQFQLNFDDTLKEPELLPARFPNLLVNGASGIAVGLATNIPPHNLKETIDAVILMIDKPKASLEELMTIMPAPDFPTGGLLINNDEIKTAYQTGRGKLSLRAKVHIEAGKAGRHLLCITEIPYQVNKAMMLEKILKLSEEKKTVLGCIQDIRDESDRSGLRAVIELKKEADPEMVLAFLYKYSDLQVTFGVNIVAIAQGKPVQMGVMELISHYIAHQKQVVTRRTQYDLEQAKNRAHILMGLIIAVDHLDEIIRLIRSSKTPKEAKERLIERFDFTEIQAQAILDLRLQRLTGLEILALKKEYEELQKLIAQLEAILNQEAKLMQVIKKELLEISKQYSDERRTLLIEENHQEKEMIAQNEIPVPEEAVVYLSRSNQMRRMNPRFFEKLDFSSSFEDSPRFVFNTMSDHNLLLFTNRGNCYVLPVSKLEESNRPKDRGITLAGLLNGLEEGESCQSIFDIPQGGLTALPDFYFFTRNGQVKRSTAETYDVKRSKFVALQLQAGDELAFVSNLRSGDDVFCLSQSGMLIRFSQDEVPAMGRTATGVRAIKLSAEDSIVLAGGIQSGDQLILSGESGYMKRLMSSMIDSQKRAGKGIKAFSFQKNTVNGSRIAAALKLEAPSEFRVRKAKGEILSFSSDEIISQAPDGRGKPYVMALMDDVVTELLL